MNKTYSLSNSMIERIREVAAEQGSTQSKVLENALTFYFLLHYSSPKNTKAISESIPRGQTDIFDLIKKAQANQD